MTSTQVTVVCPNARRQQVKTTPNLKILSILEEVCKKQGFESNEYDLIHQRKPLDVTLTLRLAGVPNNAQLELKKCEDGPRKFQDVTIALQLEDGSRLAANTFKPESTTLRQLLEASLKDCADMVKFLDEQNASNASSYPTVTYLNEQVVGLYQLSNTTLKDLGLTSGRVIVRFSMKRLDKEAVDLLNEEFRQKLEKRAKLDDIFKQKQRQEREEQSRQQAVVHVHEDSAVQPPAAAAPSSVQSQDYGVTRKPKQELEYLDQRREPPQPEPMKRSFQNEPAIPAIVSNNQPNEFANFKFPEHTKGQTLNDLNELAEIERLSKEPCDRQAILFVNERSRVDETKKEGGQDDPMTGGGDLPDEFFELNVTDIHNMLSDLKRLQNEEAPLMTKKLRELEQDKKAMKYPQIVIRISFKDGLILQGLFRPKEKISALYDFVKGSLSQDSSLNSADDLDFHLYITPPKQVLTDLKKSLFDEHLYPASIVYFKNKSERTPAFKEATTIRSLQEADELVMKFVHGAMRQVDSDGLDQLIRQERVVSNVLHSSGLAGGASTSASGYQSSQHASQAGRAPSSSQGSAAASGDVNKKLSKFLGKK